MTPQQAAALAHSLVYTVIGSGCLYVVYLISERLWITVRRWYELREINKAFESDMDKALLAEFQAKANLGPHQFDRGLLIEAVYRDMRAARTIEYEDIDADYSALTIEETTESSRSAA